MKEDEEHDDADDSDDEDDDKDDGSPGLSLSLSLKWLLFDFAFSAYLFVFDNLDLLYVVGIDWLFAKCLVLIIEINTEIVFETFKWNLFDQIKSSFECYVTVSSLSLKMYLFTVLETGVISRCP